MFFIKGFVYPADVAYPVGGPGAPRYVVMETHYNNPGGRSGQYNQV